MTLIEVMYEYQNLYQHHGKEYADKILLGMVDPLIAEHIQNSMDSLGLFINTDGDLYQIIPPSRIG